MLNPSQSQPSPSAYEQLISKLSWSVFSSVYSYFAMAPYRSINFILQAIMFSSCILNMISTIFVILGLKQTINIFGSRYPLIILTVTFVWFHAFQFSDNHQFIHEALKYLSGFYICMYIVEGAYYVKQRLDSHDYHPVYLQNNIHIQQSSNTSQNNAHVHAHQLSHHGHTSQTILKQLLLIIITVVSLLFFIFIWYNIKISKSLPYLHNDYKTITILFISTLCMYVVSIYKNVSLFLPAILTCLCMYLTVAIRIGLDLLVYQDNKHIQALGIPFQCIIIVALAFEGKERHKRQLTYEKSKKQTKLYEYDRQYIHEQLKSDKQLIDYMFGFCAMYYLYSVTHGCTVHIQYFIVPVYILSVINNTIH